MMPDSSSATSSNTSGIMYGTTMPTSPISPSTTARATTPTVDGRLPAGRQLDSVLPRSWQSIQVLTLEDHEQHRGEHRQAADQAPARMQEQLVQPDSASRLPSYGRADAGYGLSQRGRR